MTINFEQLLPAQECINCLVLSCRSSNCYMLASLVRMYLWCIRVLLLFLCHSLHPRMSVHAQSSDELFRIQLYPGQDLVLAAGSNPCTRLREYCQALNRTSTPECVRSHQHRVQEEILVFSQLMGQLEVDERLFLSCSDRVLLYPESDHGDFYLEMLQLLQSGPPGDVEVLKSFEARANEVRLDEREAVQLHKNAVLLHPNSTFALSRFGLVLRNFGHLELANSLWENTVQRGLWPSVLQRPRMVLCPTDSAKTVARSQGLSLCSQARGRLCHHPRRAATQLGAQQTEPRHRRRGEQKRRLGQPVESHPHTQPWPRNAKHKLHAIFAILSQDSGHLEELRH